MCLIVLNENGVRLVEIDIKTPKSQMSVRRIWLLLLFVGCLPAYSQKNDQVFAPIPPTARADLVKRLTLLIKYQSTQQWEKQYELLSVASTQGKSKEEYAQLNRSWYKHLPEDLILDFAPTATTVHESSLDAGWWTIEGCAKFRKKGRIVELHASVDAYRDRGNWYFSSIGVITNKFFD